MVGIENDMRAQLLRPGGLDRARHRAADRRAIPSSAGDRTPTSATPTAVERVFAEHAARIELVVHTAAQPSHDWAAREPADRLRRQRQRHAQPARGDPRATRPTRPFIFCSTNKVYGDTPNRLPLRGAGDAARAARGPSATSTGIDTSMSIDRSTHSLFGVSKAAADLLVQEYGRYFDMPTVCFRGGCLTGPQHAGAKLHGFLAYLMKCTVTGDALHRLRLRGQAGARQHPQRRPGRRVRRLPPRAARRPPSTTSAAAATATARCSRRSRSASGSPAASSTGSSGDEAADRRPPLVDHRPRRSSQRDYPDWTLRYGIETILQRDPRAERRALGELARHEALGRHPGPQRGGLDRRLTVEEHRRSPLERAAIDYEMLVVDDASTDGTERAWSRASRESRRADPLPPLPLRAAASASRSGPASTASRATRWRS